MKSILSVKIWDKVNLRGGVERKLKHRSVAKGAERRSDRLNVAQNTF